MAGDGFYVGYGALPRRHRVFLMLAVPLAIAGRAGGAIGLSAGQPPWGDGFWETGAAREFRGTLTLEPYPMLHVDGGDERVSYLLVEMGKFGAGERFADLGVMDGAPVAVLGRELRRDGRRMIEIDPGGSVSVQPADMPAVRVATESEGERVTRGGEIVDRSATSAR